MPSPSRAIPAAEAAAAAAAAAAAGGMSLNPSACARTGGDVPQAQGAVPGAGQAELAVRGDHHVLRRGKRGREVSAGGKARKMVKVRERCAARAALAWQPSMMPCWPMCAAAPNHRWRL